ncbi:MAG: hypothetical protein ABEH40_09615 [Haloferacaceae archaeon]
MSEDVFGDADGGGEEWVDVRMTDPEEGEWDVDVVVMEGRVEYVDLRVKADLLAGFVACLVDDVGERRAESVLSAIADRRGVEPFEDGADGSGVTDGERGGPPS